MIARRFLAWARIAPACARADATSALARAYLFASMEAEDRYEAEVALTVMLDDPSPLVHRALAEAIASAADAPHHLITGLVRLGGEAAALVLSRSGLLCEAELVDAAAVGDERAQTAIAEREALPSTVCAAMAEVGSLAACTALAGNRSADISEPAFLRMLERFGDDANMREALLRRGELPVRARERLTTLTAGVLEILAVERGWLSPQRAAILSRDAQVRAVLTLAADPGLDPGELVTCLREKGRLTPAFVIQALLRGEIDMLTAALADLSGTPFGKVAAFLRQQKPAPLTALLKRAGIPDWLAPLFPVALAELRLAAIASAGATAATPLRVALRRIVARLQGVPSEYTHRIVSYLRGVEVEAAREEAKALAEVMISLDEDEIAAEQRRLLELDHDLSEQEQVIEIEAEPAPIDLDVVAVARAA
jgi:uncharacterized protein (DUF2336 family)